MNEKEKIEFLKTYRQACRVLNSVGIKIKRMSDDTVLREANHSGDHDAVIAANFVVKYRADVREVV